MRKLVLMALVFAVNALPFVPAARAYTLQFTTTAANVQVRWPSTTINVSLSTSLTNPALMPGNIKAGSDVEGAARRALARWEQAGNIRFNILTSNNQLVSSTDGVNLITVSSQNASRFNNAAQGRAFITFSDPGGLINDGDVAINPNASVQFSTDSTPNTFDLEATFVHEIGHMLGLEHSGIVGASMQPRQGLNGTYGLPALTVRSLSDDDIAGLRALYGPTAGLGAIEGTTAFGVHVWAEEISTGRVMAGNIALPNGRYRIDSLPPGQYRLMAESLNEPVNATEIASRGGAYQGVGSQPQFRTVELGQFLVSANTTTFVNVPASGTPIINPIFIGTNGAASTVPVPVEPGETRNILVGFATANNLNTITSITVTSPFISVANVSPVVFFGSVPIISFDITAAADTPAGDYSVRIASSTGEVTYVTGGLTVEPRPATPGRSLIQFASTSFQIPESGGSTAVVTLSRTGDISTAASVDLTTAGPLFALCEVKNGVASPRCDFATVGGTVRFAANQGSRSVTIPVIDDRYAEGNETFTLTLGNVRGGATLGTITTTSVSIVDNDSTDGPSPIFEVPFFVRQQYLDFFSREPDPVGFAGWQATINGCPNGGFGLDNPQCDRVRVSAGFFQSLEFQTRGYFVYRFYSVAFGRRPTYAEFVPDLVKVGGAQSPEEEAASKTEFADQFILRPEFTQKFNQPQFQSPQAFVDELERTAGVTLSNEAFLVGELSAGRMTRAQVLRAVAESREVEQRFFNEAFVAMQYFGYLRRDPDQLGFQGWLNTLNTTGDFRRMIFGFIFSDEYIQRFGLR